MSAGDDDGENDELDDEQRVYGADARTPDEWRTPIRKTGFKPWHLPVKQLVREWQWADHTDKLIGKWPAGRRTVRYFTLPGPDLLDVRTLAPVCRARGVEIDYFGFDSGGLQAPDPDWRDGEWISPEASLRQSGVVSISSVVYPDALESVAVGRSQAANLLSQRPPFDVINLDLCGHLTAASPNSEASLFDALEALLRHQLVAADTWLLFLTTRVDPAYLTPASSKFQTAIDSNLGLDGDEFRQATAAAIGVAEEDLEAAIAASWNKLDSTLVRLYALGLGKHLLHYFHTQQNHPAAVELVSAFAYRVYGTECDMLAVAFRISPASPVATVMAPGVGGPMQFPLLEPSLAAAIAKKAAVLWDLDEAMGEPEIEAEIVRSARTLMEDAGFDGEGWAEWVKSDPRAALMPAKPADADPNG